MTPADLTTWAPFALAAITLTGCGLFVLTRFVKHVHPLRILWHLGTGHHLDGKHRNNRGWLHPGTRATGREARAHLTWLERRPRWSRATAFWVGTLTVIYLPVGLTRDPGLTIPAIKATLTAAAAYTLWRLLRWAARRHHRRHVVRPTATVLAGHMGISSAVAATMLKIRPGAQDAHPGDQVAMVRRIPDSYAATPSEQIWLEQLLESRIPCPLRFHWDTHTHPMRLIAYCASAPPDVVPLTEWEPAIASLPTGHYFLGCAAEHKAEVWDTTAEDPHAMVGGRTRRGKTNVNLAIGGQALHRGERITAIDPKRVSLHVLRGVPGFTLANDPGNVDEMWAAIHAFKTEMDQAIAGAGDGLPHTLILEEINQLFALFRDHWEAIMEPRARVTDVPAWRDVRAVLHQGAQFGYRVIVGGQDLKDSVLFGTRYSFGTILMTGFTPRQWGYAVGTLPVPPAPTRKGRFHLVRGTEHTLVQIIVADPKGGSRNEQAWRRFALNGRTATEEQDTPTSTWAWAERLNPTRLALPWRGPGPAELAPVLIGPTAAARHLGWTVKQFKMMRSRHPIEGEFSHRKRGQEWACWTALTLNAWQAEVEEERDRARERV